MVQYYLDLENQVKKIKENCLEGGQIQKIYSSAYLLSLSIRVPGKTWHILIGRGAGSEGVWLSEDPLPSEIRRRDNFLEYLRRHLSSCSLHSISLDSIDRVIKLDYQKYGHLQSILFFWKARKLYFCHLYHDAAAAPAKLLLSWRGKATTVTEPIENLFEYFNEVGRQAGLDLKQVSPKNYSIQEMVLEEKNAIKKLNIKSRPQFSERKTANINADLTKAREWREIEAFLKKDLALDTFDKIEIGSHQIKFNRELSHHEKRDILFEKIKKLKRGEKILLARLEEMRSPPQDKKSSKLDGPGLPMSKPVWGLEKTKQLSQKLTTFSGRYKVFPTENWLIGVGLDSVGNDQLRNKWASKEDYWIHLDGYKSAHCILKARAASQLPDVNIFSIAASILAHFSHFMSSAIPIVFTQVKNLKGISGTAGMVTFKKEKRLQCSRADISELIQGKE